MLARADLPAEAEAEVRARLAELLVEQGEPAKAQATAEGYLARFPDHPRAPWVWLTLAEARAAQGDRPGAVEAADQATRFVDDLRWEQILMAAARHHADVEDWMGAIDRLYTAVAVSRPEDRSAVLEALRSVGARSGWGDNVETWLRATGLGLVGGEGP